MQRKKTMRSRKFVQRSSSQLFSKEESSFFGPSVRNPAIKNILDSQESVFTIETLDGNNQTNREQRKASVQINPRKRSSVSFPPRRRNTLDSGLGLDSINVLDEIGEENILVSKLNKIKKMSLAARSKEKKVVSILVAITIMFTIVNIPSAIIRIMIDEPWLKIHSGWFRVSSCNAKGG